MQQIQRVGERVEKFEKRIRGMGNIGTSNVGALGLRAQLTY